MVGWQKTMVGSVAAAVALVWMFAAQAEVRSVPAGETCVFDLTDGTFNRKDNVVDLGAGATLKFTMPATLSGFAMYGTGLDAPTKTLDEWNAAIAADDPLASFNWTTYAGTRPDVSWAERLQVSSAGYAVLYSAKWNVPADGNYGFLLNIDDFGYLEIDGRRILASSAVCKAVATNNVPLTAGWHDLRIVLGNVSGNFGAIDGVVPGVAYSASNELLTAGTVATAGSRFADPGDGSVLRPDFWMADQPRQLPPAYVHIAATNGPVTVEAPNGSSLRLMGGFITAGNVLTVKGAHGIVFGSETPTSYTIDYPLVDIADVRFTATDATGLRFLNQVTLKRLPPESSCTCAIGAGADVAVRGTDTLARFYDANGALTLSDWNVYVLEGTVIPQSVPVRVGAGRTFRVKLCDEFETWRWYGANDGSITNDVELLDPTARFRLSCTYAVSAYGSLSGTGELIQDGGTSWGGARAEIHMDCSQTGTVRVTAYGTLAFYGQETAGHRENTLDLAQNAVVAFHPDGWGARATTAYVHRVVSPKNEGCSIVAGSRQTVEVGSIATWTRLRGNRDGSSAYIVDAVDPDQGISLGKGVRLALRGAAATGDDAFRVSYFPEDGVTIAPSTLELAGPDIALKYVAVDAGCTLQLAGTGSVGTLKDPGTVRLAAGADIRVREVAAGTRVDTGAGRLTLLPPASDWRSKVLLWLDPSDAVSVRQLASSTGVGQVYTNGYKLVDAWFDCRPGQREWLLLNNRMWSLGHYDLQPQVYPFLVTQGGPNGLPYMCFGTCQESVAGVGQNGSKTTEARRLQTWKGEILTDATGSQQGYVSTNVAWAVMVFGSSRGGGRAILGTSGGDYERAGSRLSDPIAKKDFELYLDGVRVSPTTARFSGGWQLLSFAGNDKVNALNWASSYQNAGGQDYGEVILFSSVPTESERRACESYLATKWGVAADVYQGVGPAVSLVGAGDVTVTDGVPVVLQGAFAGTVTLDGGTLTVADGLLPLSEAEIPSDGRIAWFDPSADGALAMSTQADRPLAVRVVHGRDNAGVVTATGSYYLLGTCANEFDRRPNLNAGARGGLATQWLDFANLYAGDTKGNTLRLFQEPAPSGESGSTNAKSVDVRTAFVALDSSNGGGMPLIDKVGANDKIRDRVPTSDINAPIWSRNTAAAVKGGVTRLDGSVVDGATAGYHGRPEVLSLETTANVPLSYFGWYGGDIATNANSEVLGEILLFGRTLPEATRAGIEAYLMRKWTGALPAGYVDLRAATVAGTGTVRARSFASLPSFADTFSGTLELGQSGFAFGLDTRKTPAVSGAASVPCAVTLPKACTITVDCAVQPAPGRYPLVSAASFAGCESLDLVVTGAFGDAQLRLGLDGGTLFIVVPARCTQIFIR